MKGLRIFPSIILHALVIKTILCLVVLCVGGEAQILCSRPLDIVFAVDVSGSLSQNLFNQIQTFLRSLAGSFSISSSTARIVAFSFDEEPRFTSVTRLDQAGAQSLAGVTQQINSLPFTRGSTLIRRALPAIGNIFTESTVRNVPRVAVFLSDGVEQNGSAQLVQPAQDLRTRFNTRIIGLGVGDTPDIDTDAFNILTGSPNQFIILRFTNNTCIGGGEDDDKDELDDDSNSSGSESDSSGDEGNCDTELTRVARLICGN